jgi:hypothetical protein
MVEETGTVLKPATVFLVPVAVMPPLAQEQPKIRLARITAIWQTR